MLTVTHYEPVFQPRAARRVGCHGPTLVRLPDGAFLCAWFGGHEGSPRTAIFLARRDDHGWSPPRAVADVGPEPHWNPVLWREGDTVYLFFKVGPQPWCWRTLWTSCSAATLDDWQEPTPLVAGDVGGRGPVKNKPLRLEDGAWLAPASLEVEDADGSLGPWDCFVDRSTDRGRTWSRSPLVPRPAGVRIIQPTLWQTEANAIHMLARSNRGRLFRSDSHDGGRTWTLAAPTAIPNNNSGVDLASLPSGALALAYNPVSESFGARTPLDVATSTDGGDSFAPALRLEDDPGEYSYPAVVPTPDGVAIAYTWRRRTIAFCRVVEAG